MAASTVARIFTGYALDPVNNLLTEFLPDVASRVHIRIIFVQRILNNIASTATPSPWAPRRFGEQLKASSHPPPTVPVQCKFSPFATRCFDVAFHVRTLIE